jgi:uncharacterized protein (DUF1800 family)
MTAETHPLAGVRAPGSGVAARVDRLTWGVNDPAIDAVHAQGFDPYLSSQLRARPAVLPAAIQAQIDAMTISQQPAETLVPALEDRRKAADAMPDDQDKKAAQQAYQQELNRLAREAASRHLLRAIYSDQQVLEEMTWFWMNHFSVHQYKGNIRAMLGDYEEHAIRDHALGRFRDLLGAVAHHPVMLRYLDNEQNAAGHVNENYARELMELHTLGVDAGYTQGDVQELARVLTGVGINLTDKTPQVRRDLQGYYVRRGLFEFNPNRHDFGSKQLLGQPIASRGLGELDEALDRLAQHPATARFISRKLAVFWVSDTPSPQLVQAMAATFTRTHGDIAQTLQAMFATPEFWQSHKFKDPTRFVVSAVRAAYDGRPILNTGPIVGWLNRLGEPLYGRQTPDGYPLDSTSWTSAGQMNTRFEIAKAIGSGNAGLFRAEGTEGAGQPAFPQMSNALFYSWRVDTLGTATRQALAEAGSPQEWNTFLLSSPEFMQR